MEIAQIRAKAFSAYIPVVGWLPKDNTKVEIIDYSFLDDEALVKFKDEMDCYGSDSIKLELKDISGICEVHGEEIAKLAGLNESDLYCNQYHHSKWGSLSNIGRQIALDIFSGERNIKPPHAREISKIIDYLRYESYNIPFMGVDLVETGIAIAVQL